MERRGAKYLNGRMKFRGATVPTRPTASVGILYLDFLASALCASLANKVLTAFESSKVYEASMYYQHGDIPA
jgi:hypothetical protein